MPWNKGWYELMLYRTLNWIDDQTIFLVIVDWWQWPHQEPGKTHPWSAPYMNLFQFAYQPRLGADNAVIYLLNHVYAHLNQPARTVKVMFFFLLPQCIQYHQADHPVWEADSNAGRCLSCVLDCWLPGWRFMCVFKTVSDEMINNTGAIHPLHHWWETLHRDL